MLITIANTLQPLHRPSCIPHGPLVDTLRTLHGTSITFAELTQNHHGTAGNIADSSQETITDPLQNLNNHETTIMKPQQPLQNHHKTITDPSQSSCRPLTDLLWTPCRTSMTIVYISWNYHGLLMEPLKNPNNPCITIADPSQPSLTIADPHITIMKPLQTLVDPLQNLNYPCETITECCSLLEYNILLPLPGVETAANWKRILLSFALRRILFSKSAVRVEYLSFYH